MKKNKTYIKVFKDKKNAIDWMKMKNNSCRLANNYKDVFCVTGHPYGYAVVDLRTSIELNSPYCFN